MATSTRIHSMRPLTWSNLYAFLIVTLLGACCRTLPTSSEPSSSPSNNKSSPATSNLKVRALDNWFACFDAKATSHRRARFNDCARAAAQLPNLIELNVFHRGGDPGTDPYALPKIKVHKSCQINIDLRFGRPDESSWIAINVAVSKIMAACSAGYGASETTGGELAAGNENFIIVTVEKTTQAAALALGGRQNSTAVASE
ncbi:MAG: hypothetical protein L6R42_007357 [Xanthoria sp. 1 TBL-2021]|nr:MAG: hypothetical protein L6R42_007357 [Xanthoria sp. 1 TBL-2021]